MLLHRNLLCFPFERKYISDASAIYNTRCIFPRLTWKFHPRISTESTTHFHITRMPVIYNIPHNPCPSCVCLFNILANLNVLSVINRSVVLWAPFRMFMFQCIQWNSTNFRISPVNMIIVSRLCPGLSLFGV